MAGSLVAIAFFILLVFLCVKGVMWGASFLVLVQGTVSCLVISLIILFALPEGSQVVGPNIPYLPISVSAVILVSAVLSIVIAQRNRKEATGNNHKAGIAVLTVGVVLWIIGFLAFCLFVFGNLEGGPDSKAAALSFSALTYAGSISLFLATTYESVRFPNIYRWIIFWASNLMFSAIFICSMIFLFAFPGVQPTTHSFWAAINSINYVPVALLYIAINHRFVKKKLISQPSLRGEDTAAFKFE
ncbi:hypothetical protein [Pelobacter seleniigenes]|uniref:hypothetical protein n=1 Tax=Pelobacter seleniigenes TaxID=407188 RepID=UPI0004A6C858|nr:hypothetical protein [Pelobacter seleniigenes]